MFELAAFGYHLDATPFPAFFVLAFGSLVFGSKVPKYIQTSSFDASLILFSRFQATISSETLQTKPSASPSLHCSPSTNSARPHPARFESTTSNLGVQFLVCRTFP